MIVMAMICCSLHFRSAVQKDVRKFQIIIYNLLRSYAPCSISVAQNYIIYATQVFIFSIFCNHLKYKMKEHWAVLPSHGDKTYICAN